MNEWFLFVLICIYMLWLLYYIGHSVFYLKDMHLSLSSDIVPR